MKKMIFIFSMVSILLASITYAGLNFGIKGAVKKRTKKVDEKVKEEKETEEEFQEAEQEKATGDANVGDVRAGKTFSKTGSTGLTGTMPNIGQENFTPTTSAQTISEGYHDGTGEVAGDADLVARNIKKGVTIFGKLGTCEGGHELPDTGQHKCYNNTEEIACPSEGQDFYGQDANYNSPASSPSYTDNGDTVTDNITGLEWVKDATSTGCFSGSKMPWEVALSSCANLVYAGHDDWRLPNVKELMSIVDYGSSSPAINEPPFANTKLDNYYWTSTTYVPGGSVAWLVSFDDGDVGYSGKVGSYYVRPVRGGP